VISLLQYDDEVAELNKQLKSAKKEAGEAGIDRASAKKTEEEAVARMAVLERVNAELEVAVHDAEEKVCELSAQTAALQTASEVASESELAAVESNARVEEERAKAEKQAKRAGLVSKLLRAGHAEVAKGEKERREALDILQRQVDALGRQKAAQVGQARGILITNTPPTAYSALCPSHSPTSHTISPLRLFVTRASPFPSPFSHQIHHLSIFSAWTPSSSPQSDI
jgi:chromosome segregation ATPase